MVECIVYTKETEQEVYQILLDEFGDDASDTIVYTYIFRLCESIWSARAVQSANVCVAGGESARPLRPRTKGTTSRPASVATKSTFSDDQDHEEVKSRQSTPPSETEAQRLVRQLLKGDQKEVSRYPPEPRN
jgi:cytoskeleton-associated protein 5